jgi:hypothetical protein
VPGPNVDHVGLQCLPLHLQRPRCRRRVEALVLLDAGLPLLQFLGGLALVAAEFGDQRDYAGGDPRHQPFGLLAL